MRRFHSLLTVALCCLALVAVADRSCLQDASYVLARSAATNLTQCLLKYSAPSRVCLKCGAAKHAWDVSFDSLSSTCQSYWVISDLNTFFSSAAGLWADANCGGCTYNQLIVFRHLACTAESCLLQTTPPYCVDILTPGVVAPIQRPVGESANTTEEHGSERCTACRTQISELSSFYNSLSDACQRARDVVDQQQFAQDAMSSQDCRGPQVPQLVFALSAAVCVVPPLLFYWLTYLFGRRSLSSVMLLRTVDAVGDGPDSPSRQAPETDLSPGQQRTMNTLGIDFTPQRGAGQSAPRTRRIASTLDDSADPEHGRHSIQ